MHLTTPEDSLLFLVLGVGRHVLLLSEGLTSGVLRWRWCPSRGLRHWMLFLQTWRSRGWGNNSQWQLVERRLAAKVLSIGKADWNGTQRGGSSAGTGTGACLWWLIEIFRAMVEATHISDVVIAHWDLYVELQLHCYSQKTSPFLYAAML